MTIILGIGALYFFELKALYLFGFAAVIYLVARSRGH